MYVANYYDYVHKNKENNRFYNMYRKLFKIRNNYLQLIR